MDPIEAADYHDITRVSDPQLSPDGETVAFVRKSPLDEEEYESSIWTVPTDGSADPEAYTTGESDAEPRYSPSEDRLAFVRSTAADEPAQLYVLPTDGGEARRVTDVVGGVSDVAWAPDGETVAFTQRVTAAERRAGHDLAADEDYEREPPDPRVIDRTIYRADQRYFDGTRSHVYTVDLASGSVERHTDGNLDFVAPTFGDATTLYYAVKRGEDPDDSIAYDIDALDLETYARETVATTTTWEPQLEATADGRVGYTWSDPDRPTIRQNEIEVHDRERGVTVRPTAALDRIAGSFAFDDDGDHLLFLAPDEGAVTLRRAPIAATGRAPDEEREDGDDGEPGVDEGDEGAAGGGGDTGEAIETVVASGHATGFDVAPGRVVVAKSEWDHPGDLFVIEASTDEGGFGERRLTTVNEALLGDRAVGEPEAVRFESDDGVEIQGWILTPPAADPDAEHPLAVEIHGGPHAMWSTADTMWHEFQTLAARGYVVFWCNPRGSTGYGEKFMAAIERDWGAVTARDVLAGVDAVLDRESVDADEQFVAGGSFGGFVTAWLVGHTDRFRAAVAQRGVYELTSFYGSTDAFKLVEGDFDATPWEDAGFLWEQSPAAHVESVDTPTLVVHAADDFRVPVNNGELFYLFLRKQGVDTRLVRYPREGHELSRSGEPGHVVDRLERIVRWFDGYSSHHEVPTAFERGDDGLTGADGDHGDEAVGGGEDDGRVE